MLVMRITRNKKNFPSPLINTTYILKCQNNFRGNKLIPFPRHKRNKFNSLSIMVAALIYSSISTRPDVAHAVNTCSRFMIIQERNIGKLQENFAAVLEINK